MAYTLKVQAASRFLSDSGEQDDRDDGDDEDDAHGEYNGGPGDPHGAFQKIPAEQFDADAKYGNQGKDVERHREKGAADFYGEQHKKFQKEREQGSDRQP